MVLKGITTSSTTSVRSRFLNPVTQTYKLPWSQLLRHSDATLLCSVSRVDNAMPCHRTGYDKARDTHYMKYTATYGECLVRGTNACVRHAPGFEVNHSSRRATVAHLRQTADSHVMTFAFQGRSIPDLA